jgi:hypothetical protein
LPLPSAATDASLQGLLARTWPSFDISEICDACDKCVFAFASEFLAVFGQAAAMFVLLFVGS